MYQESLFKNDAETLTLSAEAFPAKTSAQPARAQDWQVRALASIGRYTALQWKYDRVGYCLRMSLLCELEAVTTYSFHWQKQDTPLGLSWWVLMTSELRTDESEFGLWRTPTATENDTRPEVSIARRERYREMGDSKTGDLMKLGQQVQMWRTPNSTVIEAKSSVVKLNGRTPQDPQVGLADQVNALMWPTPCVPNGGRQPKGGAMSMTGQTLDGKKRQVDLNYAVKNWPTPRASENENRTTRNAPSHGNGHGKTLAGEVMEQRNWPTMTVSEAERGHGYQNSRGTDYPTLTGAVGAAPQRGGQQDRESSSTNGKSRALLNHRWVSQLQGFPSDWLDGIE